MQLASLDFPGCERTYLHEAKIHSLSREAVATPGVRPASVQPDERFVSNESSCHQSGASGPMKMESTIAEPHGVERVTYSEPVDAGCGFSTWGRVRTRATHKFLRRSRDRGVFFRATQRGYAWESARKKPNADARRVVRVVPRVVVQPIRMKATSTPGAPDLGIPKRRPACRTIGCGSVSWVFCDI